MHTRALQLALSLGFALTAAFGQTTTETYTYSFNGTPTPIFRDDANVTSLTLLKVPRTIQIQDLKVTVDIDYPNPSDLNVFLYSSEGTRIKLEERSCNEKATLRRITFSDDAQSRYSDYCPSEAGGTFRGNEPLSNARGQNAAGVWTLAVENNGSNDYVGWVLGYSITITGQVYLTPATSSELVVNSANLAGGGVAPGELVSIFGVNLGPSTPVKAPDGANLPTTLGGTTVTLNELTAPIKYASKYRVDIQVPYALGVPGEVWLTVNYSGAATPPVLLSVLATKPALVAVSPSGVGQLKAVNSDGTLNRNEAAKRGTEIMVYATGLGWTLPPVPAGQLPTTKPIPLPVFPITATIGSLPATVGEVMPVSDQPGVYTIKLTIPQDLSIGTAAVKISSASNSSQNGAYIRIK